MVMVTGSSWIMKTHIISVNEMSFLEGLFVPASASAFFLGEMLFHWGFPDVSPTSVDTAVRRSLGMVGKRVLLCFPCWIACPKHQELWMERCKEEKYEGSGLHTGKTARGKQP